MTPSPTFAALRSTKTGFKIWTLWNEFYFESKPYLSVSISSASQTVSPPDVQDASFATEVSNILQDFYPLSIAVEMFSEVHGACMKNITSIEDCNATVRTIKEISDKYAKDAYERVWTERPNITADVDIHRRLQSQHDHFVTTDFIKRYLFAGTSYAERERAHPTYQLAINLANLGAALKSNQLDPSVRRFIVNQGPGSCGMYFHEDLAFMNMLSIFNGELETWVPSELSSETDNIFDDEGVSGDVDDQYQELLEMRFKQQFVTSIPTTTFRPNLFRSRSGTPSQTRPGSPPPETSTRGSTQETHPPRSPRRTRQQHSTSSGTTQSTHRTTTSGPSAAQSIPDDTSYVPDSILSFQMSHFITHIQGLTNMEMRLDHMTRFSRNDEFAQQLTQWQVRNDDARTFAGNSRANKMYIITFTRANRKPIFNPVN